MTALAELPPPTFLDDLTPDSGLSLRRWSPSEYRRLASVVFDPTERNELVDGEIIEGHDRGPRLFSRDEYYRLAERGILHPEERTELIYGRIITCMSPMGRPHSVCVMSVLVDAFGTGYTIEPQMALQLTNGMEPQPDVVVLPGASEDYVDVPSASDALLVAEISDSTLRYDRGTKSRLYAANDVPDYWLVHLRARTLEVRRRPENGDYLRLEVYGEGDSVAPLAAPHSPVQVADLLPLPSPER